MSQAPDSAVLEALFYELKKVIVGQHELLELLLIALVGQGHVLVEGPPGLAKTLALKTLAHCLQLDFQRIQFTPDLLPSDLTGTRVFHADTGSFTTETGPLFAQMVLADEINRAPAKVQSALLEAMEERQVTLGKNSLPLPSPFLVMATQNPLESEGTYPLPDAQLDRFMLHAQVTYPVETEELVILQRSLNPYPLADLKPLLDAEALKALQQQVKDIFVDPAHLQQIVQWVQYTRQHSKLAVGASPRGGLALLKACQARAVLQQRHYVTQEDLFTLMEACLRHRVTLTYEAQLEGLSTADVLRDIRLTGIGATPVADKA